MPCRRKPGPNLCVSHDDDNYDCKPQNKTAAACPPFPSHIRPDRIDGIERCAESGSPAALPHAGYGRCRSGCGSSDSTGPNKTAVFSLQEQIASRRNRKSVLSCHRPLSDSRPPVWRPITRFTHFTCFWPDNSCLSFAVWRSYSACVAPPSPNRTASTFRAFPLFFAI